MELYNLYNQSVSEIYNHPCISIATSAILIILGFRRLAKKLIEREKNIEKCKKLINHNLYTKAIEHCKSIAKKYNEPIIHKHLGQAYLHINETELAIESFKKAEKLLNSPRRFFNLYTINKTKFYEEFADILKDLNKIDEAIEYYKKALEEQKQKGKCTVNTNTLTLLQKITELSEEKENLDDLDKVIDCYEEIIIHIDLDPSEKLSIYKKLSRLYEKKGNTIMVNKIREKIIEIEKIEKENKNEKEEKKENEEKKKEELSATDNPII
jgi:tetratricopeptide (TPR) repeat protein